MARFSELHLHDLTNVTPRSNICNMTQINKSPTPCCSDLEGLFSPRLFRALADPTRISLLAQLAMADGPLPVGDLAACCSPHLSVISRHLATLRDAGVVESQRVGKEEHYRLDCSVLAATLRQLADALDTCCPQPEKESSP